ncbi:UNVERIFIED_CONTAM: hypothetical protein NCL1_37947 [Trichonephila clavipes]
MLRFPSFTDSERPRGKILIRALGAHLMRPMVKLALLKIELGHVWFAIFALCFRIMWLKESSNIFRVLIEIRLSQLNEKSSMNRGFLENMSSVKKKQLWIILYLLYFLYPLTDTFVQKCDNISDNCQCHSTYTNYYYESKGQNNVTKNCLKVFTSKLNWSDAEMTCKLEYSHLLNDHMDRSFFQEFESKGINLIWVGIKKMSGFYLSLSDQASLYK